MTASDRQVDGTHYQDLPAQPARYCFENRLNNLASNIVKYATRAGRKGGRKGLESDLRKIVHYAELWLEYEGFHNDVTVSAPHSVPGPDTRVPGLRGVPACADGD